MLTNCWKISTSFFLHLLFFLPRGFLHGFEESHSPTSGANFCFVSTLFRLILSPVCFFLYPFACGRTELIYHHSQTLPRCLQQFTPSSHSARCFILSAELYIIQKHYYHTRRACIKGQTPFWLFVSQRLLSFLTKNKTENDHQQALLIQ